MYMKKEENEKLKELISSVVKDDIQQGRAIKSIFTTSTNLFITGKAGSGKTTFMRKIMPFLKNSVIVAPTGIAAINAGGATMHSFFRLPLDPYIPKTDANGIIPSSKFNSDPEYKKAICKLKTIIIDEISMVRADTLDRISDILQQIRKNDEPFGGVRLIMFGDLNQLPPVITSNESELFYEYYDSPYFFSSYSIRKSGFEVVEFNKVFRQSDPVFVDLLNNIRLGHMTDDDVKLLNSRYITVPEGFEGIHICSHNYIAASVNTEKLNQLNGEEYLFEAIKQGTPPKDAQCEDMLVLKKGCQVVMTKNSQGEYVNGSIGIIHDIDVKNGYIYVQILESGRIAQVDRAYWDNKKYVISGGCLGEQVIGRVSQYPMKLGYAITIHKCMDEETPVFTNKGFVKIKDINIGDMVNIGNGQYRKVLDKIYSGEKETIKITTKCGYEVCCTKEHKLLDGNLGFKPSSEFNVGDFIPISRKVYLSDINTNNLSIDWLIGYIIGDGSYGIRSKSKSRIDISVGNKPSNSNAFSVLSECLNNLEIPYHVYNKNNKHGKSYQFVIENKSFREKLISMGLDYQTKGDKSIPYYIYNSNIQSKSDFIRGLFDSDGCVRYNNGKLSNIVLSQSNLNIVKGIQLLLLEFGIISYISGQDVMSHMKSYHLIIKRTSVNDFNKYINFNIEGLRKKCEELSKINVIKSDIVPNLDLFKKECDITSKIKRRLNSCKNLNYDILNMSSNLNDYFSKIIDNNYFFDKIDSIECCGVKNTIDIEVDKDHYFVSGGIISSNSQGMTFDNVLVDANKSFTNGQVYVALSRCRTIEGTYLKSHISNDQLIQDQRLIDFYNESAANDGHFEPVTVFEKSGQDEINFSDFGL